MANSRKPKAPPTPDHLAALSQGRIEGKAVREYLQALQDQKQQKRTRGRPGKSAEEIQALIDVTEDAMDRLKLRAQLRHALERGFRDTPYSLESAEDAFVKYAGSYSDRHGLTYADWRSEGVSAAVLKQAGISR